MKIIKMIMLIAILLNLNIYIFAQGNNKNDVKNILIINSYNAENTWEKSVYEGFNKVLNSKYDKINMKNEYLDIPEDNNELYIENLKSLLNNKYENEEIDLVVTVDDEAFNLVREELFNLDSIFYKKIVLFGGVNQDVNLNEDEKDYITGFLDVKNQINLINFIIKLHPSINNINILIDSTIYNENIKSDLISNKYLLDKEINVNFIQGEYTKDLINRLEKVNTKDEVIIVSGVFKEKDTNMYTNNDKLIEGIKKVSNAPIYTDRQDYINVGTVGGFVDIGIENGVALGKMAIKIVEDSDIRNVAITNEVNGMYIMDYDEIYKYDINTLDIPKDTTILNKKIYDFLIPKGQKVLLTLCVVLLIVCIAYIIYQIYIQRKISRKNKRLYQMAKDREQLKTDFIVNLSHELRTPINVINSITKLLEMKINKDEIDKYYLHEKIDKINQNSNRLIRLVNNLIDITKFEEGFYECKCSNENIVYIVEDVVNESIDFANQKNIEVIFDTEEEEILCCIDKEKIERVILNIISNAIKFTSQNGKINVDIKRENDIVSISIKDNGVGIPKDKLEQIFYRFYQVDSLLCRSNEGSGIGLCITNEIVKMHDGNIKVDSTEGIGSIFEVRLPIKVCTNISKDINNNRHLKDIVKIELSDIDK